MGYGHLRAVYPLRDIAEDGIIKVGINDPGPASEKQLWKKMLWAYEFLSRARGIPLIGKPLFTLLDSFLHIPSYYPIRNLSNTTFQVNLLESSVKKGLCWGMLEKIKTKHLPVITSFYASAIAADMNCSEPVYCIICDADINRVWVAKDPFESRIEYFVPCGKAAQRLKAYGVSDEKIHLTGFPLPDELLGGKDLTLLKADLAQRLFYLDPKNRFFSIHSKSIEHFLGAENCVFKNDRKLTISFAVGGAGAQKEIGRKIAYSLINKISEGKVKLNLIAGIRESVADYFNEIKNEIAPGSDDLCVIYDKDLESYFHKFTMAMRTTDILWTKPSELSFYTGLGIPILMAPVIGSQEYFNRKWLQEIHAAIPQENPDYTDQWLFDLLNRGRVADMAWSGFLKARKLGTHKIMEVLETGKMIKENSPVLR